MSLESDFFRKKKTIFSQLEPFGFVKLGHKYVYKERFMEDTFEAEINISEDGQVSGRVLDLDLGEEYLALRMERVTGGYIGQVRQSYADILGRISEACFQALPFAQNQTNRLVNRIMDELGDTFDYPFEKYSDYVSFRIGGKWYALIFPLKMAKLGVFSKEIAEREVEVINLKVAPNQMEALLAYENIYPSYHMSKKNWVSVVLDGCLPDEEIWELILRSRQLVKPKLLGTETGPNYWLIPANLKYYDIDSEFATSRIINWTQKASIKKGDYVGIYITAPVRAVRYLCQVLEADLDNDGYRDDFSIKKLMTIQLLKTCDDERFSSIALKEYGISNIRGPRRMTKSLIGAIQKEIE